MTFKESVALVASIGVGRKFKNTDICHGARRYLGNMVARRYIINHGGYFEVTENAVNAGNICQ
jgi:hypothetical protein